MESEFKIDIYKIMNTSTPSGRMSEDGEPAGDTIRNLISENWDKYEKIIVYFEGILQMTRPFVDEGFAKLLETHTLDEFNQKLFFPDANDRIVKELNSALKLRMKIIKAAEERAAEGR
ncbi:MAG: STAS-like domain-containing protein [Candidatus Nitrohelix vancouverensis]|uniref:STAS-like domain-containing protein n=1 Tax=Candidatus Nitrohelix vancouverensis TaxID=2705534 RepID=A0A7T0G356_9BACT|nr:MAG: STAS-like domain-containing protein [Candidatus Nitrohelix vancouverensis]